MKCEEDNTKECPQKSNITITGAGILGCDSKYYMACCKCRNQLKLSSNLVRNIMNTKEELKAMDLDTAKVELSNALYAASRIIEELEHTKKIFGNGHHIRQQITKFGTDLLEERWNE